MSDEIEVALSADDLRRVLLDVEREGGPCNCRLCVRARRRVRAAAWPKVDGTWPALTDGEHVWGRIERWPEPTPGAGDERA